MPARASVRQCTEPANAPFLHIRTLIPSDSVASSLFTSRELRLALQDPTLSDEDREALRSDIAELEAEIDSSKRIAERLARVADGTEPNDDGDGGNLEDAAFARTGDEMLPENGDDVGKNIMVDGIERKRHGRAVVLETDDSGVENFELKVLRDSRGANVEIGRQHMPVPVKRRLQEELKALWSSLRMPASERLAMLLKYTSPEHARFLGTALELWQAAASEVARREAALANLVTFERNASNPCRHFSGLAIDRLEEESERSTFELVLDEATVRVSKAAKDLFSSTRDVLTYEGTPYIPRTKLDRTKLLYSLEEERLNETAQGMNKLALQSAR